MSTSNKTLLLKDLDQLFRCGIAASGDGAPVSRFLEEGNEIAFEVLVARHGPMVQGVCSRLLANPHDVDDAFQATFLVLFRRAKELRNPDRLGPWLYGVAKRVAAKARMRSSRYRHEPLTDVCSSEEPGTSWLDVMPILDAELEHLPSKHREVLILCLLNGASPEEAAAQLCCPVGTVKSRLARGREALRNRLVTRGIAPAVALAAVSSADAFASPVSSILTRATLELLSSPSIAPGILTLTQGVLPSMLTKSIVISSLLLGGVAVAGLGTARWLNATHAQEPQFAVESQRQAAGGGAPGEAQTNNNMKQILLAFHNYHSAFGHFPPLANFGADGLPKLSWRVALLPFLDENDLFKEFHQDEPWDSPHNKTLINKMPAVFQSPGSPPVPSGSTRIRGFGGKGAMFEGVQGIKIETITDGTSNTILVALAHDAIPWTQPGELPFVVGQRLPALEGSDPRSYTLGFADGSVRKLPRSDEKTLRHIITRAGGEVVMWPQAEGLAPTERGATTAMPTPTPPLYLPTAPQSTLAPAPAIDVAMTSGSTTPVAHQVQALEQRMQRVEGKLDRLLLKLDRLFPDGHSLPR